MQVDNLIFSVLPFWNLLFEFAEMATNLKYDKLQGTPPSVCQTTDLVPCCFPLAQTISVEQLIKITQNIISFVENGRGAFSETPPTFLHHHSTFPATHHHYVSFNSIFSRRFSRFCP